VKPNGVCHEETLLALDGEQAGAWNNRADAVSALNHQKFQYIERNHAPFSRSGPFHGTSVDKVIQTIGRKIA
jgi:hypothetical protein